jgi:hypothetical protein
LPPKKFPISSSINLSRHQLLRSDGGAHVVLPSRPGTENQFSERDEEEKFLLQLSRNRAFRQLKRIYKKKESSEGNCLPSFLF